MKPVVLIALSIAFLGCTCGGVPCGGGPDLAVRPACWAQPYRLAGVCNLHKVSDDLYRSAQPTAEGIRNLSLKENGIKTVVELRSFHSDLKCDIANTGLNYEHIRMKAWHPEEEDIIKFLRIVTDKQRTPVLVHCQHGADRTGTMCAVYRVAVQNWKKDEAIQEMTEGGFGFHGIWDNLKQWLYELDIDKIQEKAGIKKSTDSAKKGGP